MTEGAIERTAVSSVRVATSTRGYDISVHAYVGCGPEALREAGDLAIDEYLRVFREMKQRIEGALREAAA
jgi:hypothetical protein